MMRRVTTSLALLAIAFAVGCKDDDDAVTVKPAVDPSPAAAASSDPEEPYEPKGDPVAGADLDRLDEDARDRFERLVDELPSPCGEPHSLRTSRNTDADCILAPTAVQMVIELLADAQEDALIVELYEGMYRDRKVVDIDVAGAPRVGAEAPVVTIVEFFDYECSACVHAKPELEAALAESSEPAAMYYMMYPLPAHENSEPAARAALAAAKQGRFEEMHDWIFANQGSHTAGALRTRAEAMGLDMSAFDRDFAAAATIVDEHRRRGLEAGVVSTPTIYINGVLYDGPRLAKYIGLRLDEAAAEAAAGGP